MREFKAKELNDEQKALTFKISVLGRGTGTHLISKYLCERYSPKHTIGGTSISVEQEINQVKYIFVIFTEPGYPVHFEPTMSPMIKKSAGGIIAYDLNDIGTIRTMKHRIKEFKLVNQDYEGELPLIIVGHEDNNIERDMIDNELRERALEFLHSLNLNNNFLCDLTKSQNIEKICFFIMKHIINDDNISLKRNSLAIMNGD